MRLWIVTLVLLLLGEASLPAGPSKTTAKDPSPVEGLVFRKVPGVLYAQVPKLPAGQGLLIEKILPGSLGERVGLRHHDILLSMGGIVLKDPDHFARLLVALGDHSKLTLLRGGEKMFVLLRLKVEDLPKGVVKKEALPDVTLKAQSLGDNKMSINLRYYTERSGKLVEITLDGSLTEIEGRVRELGKLNRMPRRVQDLVEVALKRLRTINQDSPK